VDDGDSVEPLLGYLKAQRGFDFTGYKRSSLERRIGKRMGEVGIETYAAYMDHLEVHPEEFAFLFNTVLINVTAFFRDADSWEFLAQNIVPPMLEALGPDDPVRVWCAGCSSGAETYTVAMVLAEALGQEAFVDRVKIYATDIDDEALEAARSGTFGPKEVEGVPPDLLERYFEQIDARYAFRSYFRRSVIFGRNDLVQDAPISRIDLLVCRNTLMYFNAETQARILGRFHFALKPTGYLFMGRSEMLITHGELFKPLDLKWRVFSKVPRQTQHDRLLGPRHPPTSDEAHADGPGALLPAGAFDAATDAQLVVGRDGTLRLVNRAARELLGVGVEDIGRPLKDLEASYKPVELRSHLDRTWETCTDTEVDPVEFSADGGGKRSLKLRITPLSNGDGEVLGAAVAFIDVTTHTELTERLEQSRTELEASYEELQSTVEELETTNEELQSTNEELETTNEELQSTNEELETLNEELHSTNEELETINEELRERSSELDDVNLFLETILTSLGQAVIVVDRSLRVRIWNEQSSDLWGLRSEEVAGEHLLGLDIGLPIEALKPALRAAAEDGVERDTLEIEATNRRGRRIACEVTVLGMRDRLGNPSGAIVLLQVERVGQT
jgi:two-component system CheB/CheR fusion protein